MTIIIVVIQKKVYTVNMVEDEPRTWESIHDAKRWLHGSLQDHPLVRNSEKICILDTEAQITEWY